MAETIAGALVAMMGVYTLLGIVFAVPFAVRGVGRVDPGAAEAGWGFRLIITPGVVAFWPLLLLRWVRGAHAPEESNAHRVASRAGEAS